MTAKKYVVTGAYVTVRTMTTEGPRIIGLMAGAPWPADAPEDATQHHLNSRLIVEVEDPHAVNAEVTPLELSNGVTAADKVEEQEKALNRQRGAVKAAATRKAGEESAKPPTEKPGA